MATTGQQALIRRVTTADAETLATIAAQSFLESHGHSAAPADIDRYIAAKLNLQAITEELHNPEFIYYLMYSGLQLAGYSKIVLNTPADGICPQNTTKLDRLYLLADFYDLGLGHSLLRHNIEISMKHKQAGMWLYTWTENHRAVQFYKKAGFEVTGHADFKISETHSNPNHQMLLLY